jgi:DNA-binding transcriptional ArsR family regulator
MDGIFEALGEPVRRPVMEVLAAGEQPAGAIVTALQSRAPISQPAVSQHLKVLRDAGLVSVRAEGARRFYALDPAGIDAAHAWLTGSPTRSSRSPSRSTRWRPRSHAAAGRAGPLPRTGRASGAAGSPDDGGPQPGGCGPRSWSGRRFVQRQLYAPESVKVLPGSGRNCQE